MAAEERSSQRASSLRWDMAEAGFYARSLVIAAHVSLVFRSPSSLHWMGEEGVGRCVKRQVPRATWLVGCINKVAGCRGLALPHRPPQKEC